MAQSSPTATRTSSSVSSRTAPDFPASHRTRPSAGCGRGRETGPADSCGRRRRTRCRSRPSARAGTRTTSETRWPAMAPSQLGSDLEPLSVPKAMEHDDIRRVQADWGSASRLTAQYSVHTAAHPPRLSSHGSVPASTASRPRSPCNGELHRSGSSRSSDRSGSARREHRVAGREAEAASLRRARFRGTTLTLRGDVP